MPNLHEQTKRTLHHLYNITGPFHSLHGVHRSGGLCHQHELDLRTSLSIKNTRYIHGRSPVLKLGLNFAFTMIYERLRLLRLRGRNCGGWGILLRIQRKSKTRHDQRQRDRDAQQETLHGKLFIEFESKGKLERSDLVVL